MLRLLRALVLRIRLFFLRRRQMGSLALRRFFKENYQIDVGLYSYGCFDRWRMPGPLKIGRYCSFDSTVRWTAANHPTTGLTTHPALYDPALGVVKENRASHVPLVVEDDVWVGHHVTILPGCAFIGRGAVIGAGAIVTRDVAPYSIMAGSPARKIRDRFEPDVIAAIERSRWWELDLPQLRNLVARHPDAAFAPSVASLAAVRGELDA